MLGLVKASLNPSRKAIRFGTASRRYLICLESVRAGAVYPTQLSSSPGQTSHSASVTQRMKEFHSCFCAHRGPRAERRDTRHHSSSFGHALSGRWSLRTVSMGVDVMSPPLRNLKCFSPVMCQCKLICSKRTLSLMFGCKVSTGGRVRAARPSPFLMDVRQKMRFGLFTLHLCILCKAIYSANFTFYQYVCCLGVEPTSCALLTQCFTSWAMPVQIKWDEWENALVCWFVGEMGFAHATLQLCKNPPSLHYPSKAYCALGCHW